MKPKCGAHVICDNYSEEIAIFRINDLQTVSLFADFLFGIFSFNKTVRKVLCACVQFP